MIFVIDMAKARKKPTTMTELLRQALTEAKSVRAVAREAGIQQASLVRFLNGEQSLRLDKADVLAKYFGIQSRRVKSKGAK